MDRNGFSRLMDASARELDMLQTRLPPGQRYGFMLPLGIGFSSDDVAAYIRRNGAGYELRIEEPIPYSGPNATLNEFACRAVHKAPALEALIAFVRQSFGPAAQRSIGAASAPAPRVDLPEAERQLGKMNRAGRLLLDADEFAGRIKARVHGQDGSLDLVARQVVAGLAKVRHDRPLSFFFFGPSGVGKTEAALAIADALDLPDHGLHYELIRFNMNEFQERHSAYRFLGAPPGYVGHGEVPLLFAAIRNNRRLVLLFDEIEKAHQDILNTLMNLIDVGQLAFPSADGTSGEGDFRNCIVIFTSNILGNTPVDRDESSNDQSTIEFQARARELLAVRKIPPEIIGRIQWFALFHPLDSATLLSIAADKLSQCCGAYGVHVSEICPKLLASIADEAVSSSYGVRVLERVVTHRVTPSLLAMLRRSPEEKNVSLGLTETGIQISPVAPADLMPALPTPQ